MFCAPECCCCSKFLVNCTKSRRENVDGTLGNNQHKISAGSIRHDHFLSDDPLDTDNIRLELDVPSSPSVCGDQNSVNFNFPITYFIYSFNLFVQYSQLLLYIPTGGLSYTSLFYLTRILSPTPTQPQSNLL